MLSVEYLTIPFTNLCSALFSVSITFQRLHWLCWCKTTMAVIRSSMVEPINWIFILILCGHFQIFIEKLIFNHIFSQKQIFLNSVFENMLHWLPFISQLSFFSMKMIGCDKNERNNNIFCTIFERKMQIDWIIFSMFHFRVWHQILCHLFCLIKEYFKGSFPIFFTQIIMAFNKLFVHIQYCNSVILFFSISKYRIIFLRTFFLTFFSPIFFYVTRSRVRRAQVKLIFNDSIAI